MKFIRSWHDVERYPKRIPSILVDNVLVSVMKCPSSSREMRCESHVCCPLDPFSKPILLSIQMTNPKLEPIYTFVKN